MLPFWTEPSSYLNHRLCEDLLIDLQDGILDLFIRETEGSQENGCVSMTQLTALIRIQFQFSWTNFIVDISIKVLTMSLLWGYLSLKQMVMCWLTKVLWSLSVKKLQLLHLLLLCQLLFISTILLLFGWRGEYRDEKGGGNVKGGQRREDIIRNHFFWLVH